MIKTFTAMAVAGLFASTAAIAAEGGFAAADANSDGALTMEEMLTVMPSITAEQFQAADADGNGSLSEAEFQATKG